ncbi:MAG TPA: Uma2 family endonuclease [Pyrinomonadaceae bacterium]|jgi:Uma2 family endonuclease|nr:Uma2 family endonuclease [Pyrinomonadaceae bacterium]
MTSKVYPLLTTDDLLLLPDDGNRYELVEGELIVSRNPALKHQRVIARLVKHIGNYFDRNPIGEVFPNPGVIFDKHNSVIPDVVVLTKQQVEAAGEEPHIREAPALVVEVISPGGENARRDRVLKLQVYSKFGVKEYWIADPKARTLEVYRREGDALALMLTLKGDDEVTSPALPGLVCRVGEFFGK